MAGRPRRQAALLASQARDNLALGLPQVPPERKLPTSKPLPDAPPKVHRPAEDDLGAGLAAVMLTAAERRGETRIADQFEALLTSTMAFAEEVMSMKLDPQDKNFAKVLSVKQSIASSILTATARTREGLLRPEQSDGMDVVFDAIRAEGGGDLRRVPANDAPDISAEDVLS